MPCIVKLKSSDILYTLLLVAYPIAFYAATLLSYIVYNSNHNVFWSKVAYVANLAGVVMATVAALPAFIDCVRFPKIQPVDLELTSSIVNFKFYKSGKRSLQKARLWLPLRNKKAV